MSLRLLKYQTIKTASSIFDNSINVVNMQTYSQQVSNLLKRFVGKNNVLNEDYRQMTLKTTKEDLKLNKVRGSTRMLSKNVKTEKDFDLYFKSVIETPLP